MSKDELKVTYIYDDPAWDWCIGGDIDTLLEALKSYIVELGDGEEFEIRVKREDMTQAQIDAAPEQ